ncbi:MAG: extracellular solute-binding protein [Chitinophagaceae bacterium]|nr:extracellular solute-binding protein [Anaerolineae bacterium]
MQKSKFLVIFILIVTLLSLVTVQAQDKVQIRWYVGLGAGSDAGKVELQQAVVDDFNASQSEIELVLEVVDVEQAYDVLNTQIAAGNAPDIVGPMGIRGRASFPGAWLDLAPYIESTGYDLSDFDPALVDFYKVEDQGQLGLPFAVFPYFMMYNKDLFDEADLPYPPANYGDPYIDADGNELEWNMDTVTDLARILTVDANGNDATMEGFDNTTINQWGFGISHSDMRGRDTLFGAANLVNAEGQAVIPDNWRTAENWLHDAMYGPQAFYPSGAYAGSDLLADGNWFGSGHVAMVPIHLWYMGWGTADLTAAWDLAPIPAYNDVITAKLHADTFGIMRFSEHPDEAFTVLTYLLDEQAENLATIYGGMPARLSLQGTFFDSFAGTLSEQFPNTNFDVNWDVAIQSLAYPDNPNHEEGMPGFLESTARYTEYLQIVDNNADADVNAELDQLQIDLQAIFDAANASN